ncbi:MAG: hypothetical protein JWN73_1422 [Betaproteobacteria bacterium]|nr:hypothetical protein [Betaproteobacteria bacterium]
MPNLHRREAPFNPRLKRVACLLAGCALFAGSAANAARHPPAESDFRPDTPYSKVLRGAGDSVCWNVKRAFLSQGYILDRGSDSVILTGTKESQKDDKTNITIRMQTTCVDNKDGSSTVFASAQREVSELQKVRQGVSAGVSIATVTVPTGSENVLQVIRRETIQDPVFYQGFYGLVEGYVAGDKGSHAVDTSEKVHDHVASGDKVVREREPREQDARERDPREPNAYERDTRERNAAADRAAREDKATDPPAGAGGGEPRVAGEQDPR